MSNGQMFKTTTHVQGRDPSRMIPPNTVVTTADLNPAIDVGWQVSCGALVPIATNLRLVADAPTADQLVAEIDRLQTVIEQQAEVIERQGDELGTLRAELAAAKQANPLHSSGVSSGLPVAGSFGRDRSTANPMGRAPVAPPPASAAPAVVVNAAGHVVANPDRRHRTVTFADTQAGQVVNGVLIPAKPAVQPPPFSQPPLMAAAGYVPNPAADENAALKAENDALKVKFADMARKLEQVLAAQPPAPVPQTQPGLDGATEFRNPDSIEKVA